MPRLFAYGVVMKRRFLLARLRMLAILALTTASSQSQRLAQSSAGVLHYVVGRGQTTFVLQRLDGAFVRPSQIKSVVAQFRHGDVSDLIPNEQYMIRNGVIEIVPAVADWIESLVITHA